MKKRSILLLLGFFLGLSLACIIVPARQSTPILPAPAVEPAVLPQNNGVVTEIILAENVDDNTLEPVNPTQIFQSDSVIHAVVRIKDAPPRTHFYIAWFTDDIGDPINNGILIDALDMVSEGTQNLSFSLKPDTTWTKGTYRFVVLVNTVMENEISFSVK
jgi:hypothetical protein